MSTVNPVAGLRDLIAERDRLRAAVDAALALHHPVKRYHDGSGEWSYDNHTDAADHAGDVATIVHFEVCAHCGYLETWANDEAGEMYEYREGLWPCATVRALAPVADPAPHSDEETT